MRPLQTGVIVPHCIRRGYHQYKIPNPNVFANSPHVHNSLNHSLSQVGLGVCYPLVSLGHYFSTKPTDPTR